MTESVKDSVSANAAALLIHYSFDLNGYTADELVTSWATTYQPLWVRSAVIEALYQGRYKAVSVEQILVLWLRRGQPLYHFNHEFERIICSKFPQVLVPKVANEGAVAALPPPKFPPQSHWRYLLPGATNVASIRVVPATSSASWLAPSRPSDDEELSNSFDPIDHLLKDKSQEAQVEDERSQPESPLEPPPERQQSATTADLATTPNWPVTDSPQAIAEPNLPTRDTELPAATAPSLPPIPAISSDLSPVEPAIAADVSLESVLAEADRLLEDLTQCDRDSYSVESALANQAKPEPIHQFVPITESSEFYSKLKAVAQPAEDVRAVSEPLSSSESNSQRA